MKMDWNNLFSEERERPSQSKNLPFRNCFDMDYDRIVYSSSLRRLQDKAQVFPLQENDFTRTRLTHSIEVSAIGRSLGLNIEYRLKNVDNYFLDENNKGKLPSLLMVAGLVHDLGNPPFGHYGEDIIKDWFSMNKEKLKKYGISDEQLMDYEKFDGNAQTIRILTRLQCLNDRFGMNFCFGTLATLMKYPWPSTDVRCEKGKFGYFSSEKDLYAKIINSTSLVGRHPATYLLEAADDITYLFADLEDALKKHCFDFSEFISEFNEKFPNIYKEPTNMIVERSKREKDIARMQNFKIQMQGIFINNICDEFVSNYNSIMNGTYKHTNDKYKSLLNCEKCKELEHFVRNKCIEFAYENKEVLTLELVGKEVLDNLLNKFVFAALETTDPNAKSYSKKIYKLISENFKYIHEGEAHNNPYERIQIVVDYISGMTDSYALNLNKKLLGMRI